MPTENLIAAAREKLNMNQPELACEIGVNQSTVSRWENGEVRMPPWARKAVERLIRERNGAPA